MLGKAFHQVPALRRSAITLQSDLRENECFVLPEKSPRQIRFDKRFGSIVHFVRYPNLHLRSDCLIDRQLGVATPAADVVDYLAERQVC